MSYFGIPVRNGLPIGLGSVAPLGANNSFFSPASFFANGEQGWWYDPSNFSTLFQDSGATPVTAVEQPVGLQLDLSQGLVLGSETIGAFLTAGYWSIYVAGVTFPGSSMEFDVSPDRCAAPTVFTAGKIYRCQVTFASTGNPVLTLDDDGSGGGAGSLTQYSPNGGLVSGVPFYFRATTSNRFRLLQAGTGTASVTGFSVKEVAGNHRFQTTSANRPVVSARVNLLTKTEQFDDAVWTKANVTASGTRITANAGTFAAYVVANSSSTPATSMTFSAIFPPTSGRYRYVWLGDRGVTPIASATFDLQTVSVIGSDPSVTATASTLPDGSVLCSIVYTKATAGISGLNIALAGPSYTSDRPSLTWSGGEFVDAKASFVMTNQGVGLPVYQRVNTSTDYDSTGFPIYIKPNGSNQFMVTNSINFTTTDKMTVWQGVRKLSDAALGMITELSVSVGANNGSFYLVGPSGSSQADYTFVSKGTSSAGTGSAGFAAPTTNVVTGIGNISGDVVTVRINGTQVGTNTADQGTGNFGNYPAYFYMRAGTSLPFNGHDYGSIARGAASTAAQITNGETYINSKTKAYT
jgi:hypothetical protein